jgi:acetylornithine aminotransferase
MGRTGAWFAHQAAGIVPDIVTVAKGLGGGFPIGACLGLGRAADLLQPGNHGTTFGGNPPACAVGLAVLATIEDDGLLDRAVVLGQKLRDGLRADPRVAEVTGDGLLIGVVLTDDKAAAVAAVALRHGFIVNDATPRRLRLAPPLVLTDDDAQALLTAWPAILDEAGLGHEEAGA